VEDGRGDPGLFQRPRQPRQVPLVFSRLGVAGLGMVDDPHTDPAAQGTFQTVDDLRKFDFVDRDIDGPARALRAFDGKPQQPGAPRGGDVHGQHHAGRPGVGLQPDCVASPFSAHRIHPFSGKNV
jgi:hypothetical protein